MKEGMIRQSGDAAPASGLRDGEACAVCSGGWSNYWNTILSGRYAPVCRSHIAESRESDKANIGMPSNPPTGDIVP